MLSRTIAKQQTVVGNAIKTPLNLINYIMKKFFLLFIFTTGLISAQEFSNENDVDKFVQVMEVNKNKNDIYKAIKLYLNQNVKKTNLVLDVDDETNGIISYSEYMEPKLVSEFEKGEPTYKVTIEIKDNKFRYTASPININENLVGIKLERSLTRFAESSTNDAMIKKNEEAIKNEKKEKKITQLKSQIEDYQKSKSARLALVELVKLQLKQNVVSLKEIVEKKDDW